MKTPAMSTNDKVEEAVAQALYAAEWKNIKAPDFAHETADQRKYWIESARTAIMAYKKAIADAG